MTESDCRTLLDWIARDRDKLVGFLAGFVRAASPNPPGDTRQAVHYLCRFLTEAGAPDRVGATKLWASLDSRSRPSRGQTSRE